MMKLTHSSTILIVISIIGVLTITSWILLLTPMLKNELSSFEDIREYAGRDAYVESIGDKLPDEVSSKDILEYKVVNTDGNILEIISTYSTFDVISGEQIYENTNVYFVDRTTRQHVDNEEWYFIFPYNVQKQNYLLIDPNMEVPATFVFEEIKHIGDIEVFVFSCKTFGDDFSDAWKEFAPITVFADQTCKTSIEPITGKTIQFSITWDMYVIQDGSHISIEYGGSQTTDYSENVLLNNAKKTMQLFYIYDFIIPIFLTMIFVAIFLASLYNNKSKEKEKIIIKQYEDLVKSERLAAIGELSARIAHDIRNPLGIIKTSLENIKTNRENPEFVERSMFRCNRAINRIAHQIDEIMDFLKDSPLELESISLLTSLQSIKNGLEIPDGIKLILPTNDVFILGDKIKIESLFYNLIINAIQKLDDKGTITIRASNEADNMVKIKVEDDGAPIPEDDLKKIFEPLFTTKQKGTGLGLASCKKIIEQHVGYMSVSNDPVTFAVILPSGN